MPTVEIYGHSDDIVYIDGKIDGAGEYPVHQGTLCARIEIRSRMFEKQRLSVYAIYDGCWHFSVGQIEEGDKDPGWLQHIVFERYTTKLTLDVQDDAKAYFHQLIERDIQ